MRAPVSSSFFRCPPAPALAPPVPVVHCTFRPPPASLATVTVGAAGFAATTNSGAGSLAGVASPHTFSTTTRTIAFVPRGMAPGLILADIVASVPGS